MKRFIFVLLACFIGVSVSSAGSARLSFEQRVAYQRAIEEVYWKHTVWPDENPQPKPGLSAIISEKEIRGKVIEYLRKSQTLEISGTELQAEMDRMAHQTKDPATLQELFSALKNDPYLIAECLARPLLVERAGVAVRSRPFDSFGSAEDQYDHYRLPQMKGSNALEPFSPAALATNTWATTTTTGAPSARRDHTAVWTGTQMIVWGGEQDPIGALGTGSRYNPATNSWSTTSLTGAPSPRYSHTAIWTGTQMIIWGGSNGASNFNNGARYNPSTNSWQALSTTNAAAARTRHTAVWTGTQMIVWGGLSNSSLVNTGARYTPSSNSWSATSTVNAPTGREDHTAIWTGAVMIVWGGETPGPVSVNTGAKYNPSTNSWTPVTTSGAPSGRYHHTAVWTGSRMIIWGGSTNTYPYFKNTGGQYSPSSNTWTPTSTTNAPSARYIHTAVWTGSRMIIWGGFDGSTLNSGRLYDPSTNNWTSTSTISVPAARYHHTAVWAGSRMIIWGGDNGNYAQLNTGGRYIP